MKPHKRILIIADIEGTSLCRDYHSTTFLGKTWPNACLGMTRDVNAVVKSLFKNGAQKIYVKDFHRTGFNIFPEQLDRRAVLHQGYSAEPVPGIGNPYDTTGLIFLGMHAPSGEKGFLPHTLTSRISSFKINGETVCEAQLFAGALAASGLSPIFFSGCPDACRTAAENIKDLAIFPLNRHWFHDGPDAEKWRRQMADKAADAVRCSPARPYHPKGPFCAAIKMKQGEQAAALIARRWKFKRKKDTIYFTAQTYPEIYRMSLQAAFLTPLLERLLPVGLPLYHLIGRAGLKWAAAKSKQI